MNSYKKALQIATQAHKGQTDKAGKEYLLHPIRLANQFSDKKLKIVAILHDVMEDSKVSINELSRYFTSDITNALLALTHTSGSYNEYVLNIRKNPIALQVKLVDLRDNMDLTRLKVITEKDELRKQKYENAYKLLTEV